LTKQKLTLGVLWTSSCLVQTDLFTFDFTSVPSHIACFPQNGTQAFVVIH